MWRVLLALPLVQACYTEIFSQAHWPFCQEIQPGLTMYFGPSADGDFMKLGLFAANHSGWSALGVGGNGGMKGAQQIVVRQVGGAYVAEERYSTDYVTPALQETQEVLLIFGEERDGHTSWGVLLPTKSCKAGERYAMEDVGMYMHWALGFGHDFGYHKSRGQLHTNLVGGPPPAPPDMSSYPSLSLTMPNVDVVLGEGGSDAQNPYICGIFDLEEVLLPLQLNSSMKLHAARFAPLLDAASRQYVHHMILFECSEQAAMDNNFTHNQVVGNCERMLAGCQTSKWPWAVGGEDLILPSDVGLPVGDGARWYALQMHYYNPSLDVGVKDNSGVRISLAPALRTHDAEYFGVTGGVNPMQREPLPPGQAHVSIASAVLPAQCTNQWDVEEINVLGVMHHAHTVGKRISLEVTRAGEYLGEMRREKIYDFNHQSLEGSSVKKLRRGDEITLSCSYDTSSRSAPTAFGDYTQDEMCLAGFVHYPAQRVRRVIFIRANLANRISMCVDPSRMGNGFDPEGINQSVIMSQAVISTAPVLTPPACVARGDLESQAAAQVLEAMGYEHPTYFASSTSCARAALGFAALAALL